MGIKEYIKNKHKKQKGKDILDVLNTTIDTLEVYLKDLEEGNIHTNVKDLEGEALIFANRMVENESHYVKNAIKQLSQTYGQIYDHRVIDTITPTKSNEEKSL